MICDECGENAATIKVIDVVDGTKSLRMLCEACYGTSDQSSPFTHQDVEKGDWSPSSAQFELPGLTPSQLRDELLANVECDDCGYTLREFEKHGRVRCHRDYETFTEHIESLLKNLHGAAVHTGSAPKRIKAQQARTHRIVQLENELGIAIHEEDYEGAASLRDRISSLRSGGDATSDD